MYQLLFTPESRRDLKSLKRHIQRESSLRIATNYVESLQRFCETLQLSPHRGEERPHARPGLRSIGFKRRVSVFFTVSDKEQTVRIIRILYAGRQAGNEFR